MNPLRQLARRQPSDDAALVAGLRADDRAAFETLIERHHAAMVRVASLFVPDRAVAEEVAQETWLAVLEGIDRFEERSSLKTWIFRILTNRAKTRAQREGRSVPLSALGAPHADEPVVDADRFLRPGDPEPGAWASRPRDWETIPEERLLSQETLAMVARAIEELPAAQREVIRLRDVEGWSAGEVCDALGITDGNQRVLLHRARSKVRQALEDYLEEAA
jgi:RNA polymerase sigma-70 factor (ECF subfamily)